jgi:hypothetical protein
MPVSLGYTTPSSKPPDQVSSRPSNNGAAKPKSTIRSPYRITPPLLHLAVPVDDLVLDPMNARLHPERNLEAIKKCLVAYGQMKPIVVRKQTKVVVAGNGTLRAAKALGWTHIAAVIVDMTDAEAAGYGLADNRTAELAKWDFEVVSRIDKLLQEHGHSAEGWTDGELERLRRMQWEESKQEELIVGSDIPNFDSDDAQEKEQVEHDASSLLVSFTPDGYEPIDAALSKLKELYELDELDPSDALSFICKDWLERLEADDASTE